MNRSFLLAAGTAVSLAGALAIGIGSAGAQSGYIRPCNAGENPVMTGTTPSCIPAGQQWIRPCNAGEVPVMTGTTPSCITGGGQQGQPPPGGQQGQPPPGGQQGQPPPGGPPTGLDKLPECAPGVAPTRTAPCRMNTGSGSAPLPECTPGVAPGEGGPCMPPDANPQFEERPPAQALKKLLTLDVDIDGSGEDPGTFDVTLNRIIKGIGKKDREQLQDQMEGDSFIIIANKAKCFADKKSDKDAIADKISCKVLSDETDDIAQTLKATVQVRMKFDNKTFQPTFTATKVVIRGKNKI